MNPIAVFIFLLSCTIRVAGNMYYAGLEERLWAYWWSRNVFEVIAVLAVLLIAKGIPRAIVAFFLGLAVYNAAKELACPTCLNWNEYIGFAIGAVLFAAQILRHAREKRARKKYAAYK